MTRKDFRKLAIVLGFFAVANLALVITFWMTQHRLDLSCLSIVVVCGPLALLTTRHLVRTR